MDEVTNADQLEAWLKIRPREDAVLIAARCALRVFPLLAPVVEDDAAEHGMTIVLATLRAISVANVEGTWPTRSKEVRAAADKASDVAYAVADVYAAADAYAYAVKAAYVAAYAADVCAADTVEAYAVCAANSAEAADAITAPYAYTPHSQLLWKMVQDDAIRLDHGSSHGKLREAPLWHAYTPVGIHEPWHTLRDHLLAAGDDWFVWVDWYQDRLDGRPANEKLEVAKALIPNEIWEAGPATLNAEIARLIAEQEAERPAGEGVDFDPVSEKVVSTPAPIERENAFETAVSLVEDSLSDLRASAVGNRCYALNHVFVRLDRMLTKYRDNPLRLHEDMKFAAEEIVTEIGKDNDLDEGPVRALRDACGQGVIDIRISVPEVAEMAADRQRRIARKPSVNARRAVDRLMDEIGEGIDPDLREQMIDDLKSVEQSRADDGEEMADGASRDAFLTSVHRFAWLYRFSRLSEGRIVALAQRLDATIESIERAVTLFRGAEGWWAVIEWLMKVI